MPSVLPLLPTRLPHLRPRRTLRTIRDFGRWLPDDARVYTTAQLEEYYKLWLEKGAEYPAPEHLCTADCNNDPGSCPIYKRSVGYPGSTK